MTAAYTVHNKYGFGFLEKFYHNSLLIESTGMEIGLLVNFEKSDEVRRKIIGKSVKSVSNSNYFKKTALRVRTQLYHMTGLILPKTYNLSG